MRVSVDTSVWIAALRHRDGPEARHLSDLLDDDRVVLAVAVRVELLAGASRKDRERLRRVLSAIPVLYPGPQTWTVVDSWITRAGDNGECFGFADLLIGALAAEDSAQVWSHDADFARMERLGLLKLHGVP